MSKREGYAVITIAVMALVGMASLATATRWGVGITTDSMTYIGVASNLLNGLGFTERNPDGVTIPLIHYPPLFPALLAIPGVVGMEPSIAARWLNIILFGANILLVGLAVKRITRDSIWLPVFGSFLMLSSRGVLHIHSYAWTEPAFIFFALLGFLLLSAYLENSRLLFLVGSSGVIALAFLVRYPGLALVATGVVGILLLSKKGRRDRMVDALRFGVISSVPLVLWVARNSWVADSATGREIVFHPFGLGHVMQALRTVSIWLLPARIPEPMRVSLLVLVVFGIVNLGLLMLRQERRVGARMFIKPFVHQMPYFVRLLAIFVVVYGLLLVGSISFADAETPLDDRILSPVYVSAVVFILYCMDALLRTPVRAPAVRVAVLVMCTLFAVVYLRRGTSWVAHGYNEGWGLASKTWQQSEILQSVRALRPETPIYSNGHDVIFFLTGRFAWRIPNRINPNVRQANSSYSSQLLEMRDRLESDGGVVVYFRSFSRWYQPTEQELESELQLRAVTQSADGAIYQADSISVAARVGR